MKETFGVIFQVIENKNNSLDILRSVCDLLINW